MLEPSCVVIMIDSVVDGCLDGDDELFGVCLALDCEHEFVSLQTKGGLCSL